MDDTDYRRLTAPSGTGGTFPSRHHQTSLRQVSLDPKRGYSQLTTAEKWLHHAYIYGFRRVFMNSRDPVSPPDPDGTWFDAGLADKAEGYYRTEFRPSPLPVPELARYRDATEAREASAKARGYEDFKHAMAAGLRHAGLASAPPRTRREGDES